MTSKAEKKAWEREAAFRASKLLRSRTSDPSTEPLESNVFKTALFFEGGSMRAAYTCAVAAYLLEKGIYFHNIYGVSAGSSNTINYASRDVDRTIFSFTDFLGYPGVGDWKTLMQGKGLFSAKFIYQDAGVADGAFPLDFATFKRNTCNVNLFSFDANTGEDLVFTKDQMTSAEETLIRVRASSTLPMLMPPPTVDGRLCFDGGFAEGGGLPVRTIMGDGFDRIIVVRTRKRDYRKHDKSSWANLYFWNKPKMRDAVLTRSERYNQACDLIDQMEKDGRAYVFYPEDLTLSGNERDLALFRHNYEAGYAQVEREFAAIMHYVEQGE